MAILSTRLDPLRFLTRLHHSQLLLHLHYDLLHLKIGPLPVLRIHVQFLRQRGQPILKLHLANLFNSPLQLLQNHPSVGLIAQQFYSSQGCAICILHLGLIIIDWFIGLFQLFLQGLHGLGGLLGKEELGLVEMFVGLAIFAQGFILLFEREEIFAELCDLGAACFDGLSQHFCLLIVSFLQQSIQFLFLCCQSLTFFLQSIFFFLYPCQLLVRLIYDHPQVLILFPFTCQLLGKSCIVPLFFLNAPGQLLLTFLHHCFALYSLSFQLISDGDQSLVVVLIGATDFKQILLQSLYFPLQGCPIRCQLLLDLLQCPIFLYQSINILSAVYRPSRIQSLHRLLVTLPNFHHLLPHKHVLLPQESDFLPQLLLTLRLQLMKTHGVICILIVCLEVGVVYEGFAGRDCFCFRVLLAVQEVIGEVLICMRWQN